MKRKVFAILIATALQVGFCSAKSGVWAPKTFTVKVYGKGQPMILIPGYACSGDVWDGTVKKFSKKYECHVLTLAGFAGVPQDSGSTLLKVRNEIIEYVKTQNLKQPILMGHSMGGTMALWLAETEPTLFSKVIVVDEVPFYSLLFNPSATVESAKPLAQMKKTYMLTADLSEADVKKMLEETITDSVNIATATKWFLTSDKNTLGQYIYDISTTDLRDSLPNIKSPLLVLGSWHTAIMNGSTKDNAEKEYADYYKTVSNCKVVIAENAKHFIMLDDPEWFYNEVEAFLK